MVTNPQYIIIHHSLTPDGRTLNTPAIRRYHTEDLGWEDVGYQWLMDRYDYNTEIIAGRIFLDHGAHCKVLGMNYKSIGICVIGNYDISPPTEETLDKLRKFVLWNMKLYNISLSNVLGHGEAQKLAGKQNPKSCPGKLFDMESFRSSIYGQLHHF